MFLPSDLTLGPEIVLPRNGLILFNTQRSQISLVDNSTAARARGALNHCSGERDAEAAGEVRGDAVFKVSWKGMRKSDSFASEGYYYKKSGSFSPSQIEPDEYFHSTTLSNTGSSFPILAQPIKLAEQWCCRNQKQFFLRIRGPHPPLTSGSVHDGRGDIPYKLSLQSNDGRARG